MNEHREQRMRNLLGMAQRAGRIASGKLAVEKAVKSGNASLMIIASDTEEAAKKAYQELADKYVVPCRIVLTKESLGTCLGREYRAAAVLTDEGFSKSFERLLGETEI